MTQAINDTLRERGARYGSFTAHAEHTQAIKRLLVGLMGVRKWNSLDSDQKESLEMIAHKLGRITNGDPHYADSWHDIAGYAQLVADRLAGDAAEPEPESEPKEDTPSIDDELLRIIKKFL